MSAGTAAVVPRVRGGPQGARRTIPGVRSALIERYESLNRWWGACQHDQPCDLCVEVEALQAGEPGWYSGEDLWAALFHPAHPRDFDDLCHDTRVWRLLPNSDDLVVELAQEAQSVDGYRTRPVRAGHDDVSTNGHSDRKATR